MENFIYDYYIKPIWDKTGYNIVNTLTYAVIAIVAIYLIRILLKSRVKIDREFIFGALSFVLFGSTIRVVTDSIDSGVFKAVSPIHKLMLDSHIWDYGYFTVTPGIYIVTAGLFLLSLLIFKKLNALHLVKYAGLALWIPHFIILVPFMAYAAYAIPIVILAAIPAYLAYRYFKDMVLAGIVMGQALDGAATFFVIDIFSKISGITYFEQHVFSSAIGEITGTFFTFYLLKSILAFGAAHVLKKETVDREDLNYLALILMIMGFAPGIRDILRMMVGG